MDKLDNETWEEYALRHNLFKIKYTDADNSIIDDIYIPDYKIANHRHHNWKQYFKNIEDIQAYSCLGFMEFIMYELYKLCDKYKHNYYYVIIKTSDDISLQRELDINRQAWLFKQLDYFDKKHILNMSEEEQQIINNKKLLIINEHQRFDELKLHISETHKEQLDEIITLIRKQCEKDIIEKCTYGCPNNPRLRLTLEELANISKEKRKKRIELYEKYIKNKEIQTKITELEQQINNLKVELDK